MLQTKEHASIPCSSVIFTSNSQLSLLKGLEMLHFPLVILFGLCVVLESIHLGLENHYK
jgi:hypothetical protein